MSEFKLSDQLGAMAIIDELYQKQQLLLEHLDRETLHRNLQRDIKSYYQTQGLPINDETIEKGIKLWFDKRLRFNAPSHSRFQDLLIYCYISRNIIVFLVVIVLFICTVSHSSKVGRVKQLQNDINTTYNHIQDSKQSLDALNNEFIELNKQPINFVLVPAKKLKAIIVEALNQDDITPLTKPVFDSSSAIKKDTLNQLQQIDISVNNKLAKINSKLLELRNLLATDQQLAKLILSEPFINASKQYPILQVTVDAVLDSLNRGEKTVDLTRLETLYSTVERAEAIKNKIRADNIQLHRLNVPESDMAPVTSLQTALKADLKELNFTNVENYQTMIAYYIKLAQTPLNLIVVDNPNYKSGIVRTHDDTHGQSWYLIVTPTLPSGIAMPIWVKSIETGEMKLVSMFGQQVTQDIFNVVRADKAQDGHIDNNLLCQKTIGRLTFVCPSSVKPGRILEW